MSMRRESEKTHLIHVDSTAIHPQPVHAVCVDKVFGR